MNRYILIFFFIVTYLYSSGDNSQIKLKVKHKKNITEVKLLVKSQMRGIEISKLRIEPDYITNLDVKLNNTSIFNIDNSFYIASNPLFIFKYKSTEKKDLLEIFITNNKGIVTKSSTIIEEKQLKYIPLSVESKELNKETNILKHQIWKAQTTEDAIESLYGKINIINTDKITLRFPEEANGASVPINIKSTLDLESIAIFSDGNLRSTIALITIPPNGIIDYRINVKLTEPGLFNLTVIGKGKNGNFYKQVKQINSDGGIICFMSGGGSDEDWKAYCNNKFQTRGKRLKEMLRLENQQNALKK